MKYNKQIDRVKSFKVFKITGKDSSYGLLVRKFFDNIQDEIMKILNKEKKMSMDKAENFLNNMLSLEQERQIDIKKEVDDYYGSGLTPKEAAKELLNKYYKITLVNKYNEPMEHEEITEVTENKSTTYYHWKTVSPSLFWNFVKRVNKLHVKFLFDTSYISGLENSLNHNSFRFYIETPTVNKKDVEYEFMYSKLLSDVVKTISTKNKDEVKFYIAVDKNNLLTFGYIIDNTRYIIGKFNYKSSDIFKLYPYVKPLNNDIDFKKLSNGFKVKLQNIDYYKKVLETYTKQYNNYINSDGIVIYSSVINNELGLIVDTNDNDDVITKAYLENILHSNTKKGLKTPTFYVEKFEIKGKTHYYIIFRK